MVEKINVALTYTADIPILPRLKTGFSYQLSEISGNCMGYPVKFTDPDHIRPLLKELIGKIKKNNTCR